MGETEHPAVRPPASHRFGQTLPALIGLASFLAALGVLRAELRAVTWHTLSADVFATPSPRLGLALFLTVLNYAALTGYDFLALAYIGKRLSRWRIAGASQTRRRTSLNRAVARPMTVSAAP